MLCLFSSFAWMPFLWKKKHFIQWVKFHRWRVNANTYRSLSRISEGMSVKGCQSFPESGRVFLSCWVKRELSDLHEIFPLGPGHFSQTNPVNLPVSFQSCCRLLFPITRKSSKLVCGWRQRDFLQQDYLPNSSRCSVIPHSRLFSRFLSFK